MDSNSTNDITNDEEVTANPKPRSPQLKKFVGNEYEDMRLQLNEIVLATNVAYDCFKIRK